ncbi:winged helix-turn-helix domain-containing protein (plasmid) [Polymorphobacter sp. PAMC 29334]|nr:winged helix-turn-helix domain-containing protein [Polymorphobacter sp. PAMC 29334]
MTISPQRLSQELHGSGYRKLTARPPHHTQDPNAISALKKTSPRRWQRPKQRSQRARP